MTENELLDIFRKHSAILEGHTSFSRQDCTATATCNARWFYSIPRWRSSWALSSRRSCVIWELPPWPRPRWSVLVSHEVARALGTRALFTERQEGAMVLRRGFSLAPGETVLVVEDVITTGLSTRETIQCVEQAGGNVVGAGALTSTAAAERRVWAYPGRRSSPFRFRTTIPPKARSARPEAPPSNPEAERRSDGVRVTQALLPVSEAGA